MVVVRVSQIVAASVSSKEGPGSKGLLLGVRGCCSWWVYGYEVLCKIPARYVVGVSVWMYLKDGGVGI